MSGDREKSLDAGMNDHITKPIDPDTLFATLLKWIPPFKDRSEQGPREIDTEEKTTGAVSTALLQSDLSEAENDGFPESLPGFDLAAGLQRLRGNYRLYKKLLIDFAENYRNMDAEIKAAMDAGEMESAHSLIHNLKGLAGNIAATELHSATVGIEKQVKEKPASIIETDPFRRTFEMFQTALSRAIEAVQVLKPAPKEPGDTSIIQTAISLPPELAQDTAQRLRDAAEMGDVTELKAISDALKSQSDAFAPISKRIVEMAEDFDLDGILKLADELTQLPRQ